MKQNANIRLNACCIGKIICQSTAKRSQMLKVPFHIIPRLGVLDDEARSTTLWTPSHRR